MWSQKKNKWNDPFGDDYSRVVGYTDCLDESSNTKMLTNWFRKMEQIIWQNNKTIGEYENAKRSTAEFIKHMTGSGDARVYYDKRSEELMCMIDDERLVRRLFSYALFNDLISDSIILNLISVNSCLARTCSTTF